MKNYRFHIYINGNGNTPEEGWEDALEAFSLDPGEFEDENLISEEELED